MLGGQVCYLPSRQAAQYLGFPAANDSHSIILLCILAHWAGNKPALPAFIADCQHNNRNTFILSTHLTEEPFFAPVSPLRGLQKSACEISVMLF